MLFVVLGIIFVATFLLGLFLYRPALLVSFIDVILIIILAIAVVGDII